MPIYEFRCLECGSLFEKLFTKPDAEVEISCPKCQSGTFERVISKTSYVMRSGQTGGKKPAVTTKSCSSGNGCTTLEIPGPDD